MFTREVDINDLISAADYVGNGESVHNRYQRLVEMYYELQTHGLHPIVLADVLSGTMLVTTRENLENKLN